MSGVLLLCGPTASGKTQLALDIAQRAGAEIVGADSRQIYRGMTIGTAAPTPEERACVPHHLIEFLDPHERYSAARFVHDALQSIAEIHGRGKRALVVGGTGFYLRALCGDVVFEGERAGPERMRLEFESSVHPPEVLHDWLRALDPARAAAIAPNDRYRIGRALEAKLAARYGGRARAPSAPADLRTHGVPYRKLALSVSAAELDARIRRRVDAMLAAGFVSEAERIGAGAVAADAVGYREALGYLRGWMSEGELRERLFRRTRQYAKRQVTWLRSEPGVQPIASVDAVVVLEMLAKELPGWK